MITRVFFQARTPNKPSPTKILLPKFVRFHGKSFRSDCQSRAGPFLFTIKQVIVFLRNIVSRILDSTHQQTAREWMRANKNHISPLTPHVYTCARWTVPAELHVNIHWKFPHRRHASVLSHPTFGMFCKTDVSTTVFPLVRWTVLFTRVHVFDFVESLSGFPQFFAHYQQFFHPRVLLRILSDEKDDVFHWYSSGSTDTHRLFRLKMRNAKGDAMYGQFQVLQNETTTETYSKPHPHEKANWHKIVCGAEHFSALTISVMYSWTRSSRRSTDSEYGFWSSPKPYIIHRTGEESEEDYIDLDNAYAARNARLSTHTTANQLSFRDKPQKHEYESGEKRVLVFQCWWLFTFNSRPNYWQHSHSFVKIFFLLSKGASSSTSSSSNCQQK